MKLIHCADLHLDSKMDSNLSSSQAKERRGELLSSFVSMVDYAEESGVCAILICGDLFDSSRTSRKTEQYVLDVIARHKDLFFFYLAGNHDLGHGISERVNLPPNLLTFGDEWSQYHLGDEIEIFGCERPDPDLFVGGVPDQFNIVLMHGQYTNPSEKDYIAVGKIKDKNVDYLALGHIHTYFAEKVNSRCVLSYSGCLEGRGFDECGPKGFALLDVEDKKLKSYQLIPFAKRCLHTVELPLDDCASQWDLEQAADAALSEIPSKDLVKLVLAGKVSADALLDFPRLKRSLSERFYFVKIEDKTTLKLEEKDYSNDVSLKGEFIRQVMSSSLSEEEKERIISCGFRALKGEEPDL